MFIFCYKFKAITIYDIIFLSIRQFNEFFYFFRWGPKIKEGLELMGSGYSMRTALMYVLRALLKLISRYQ